MPVLDDLGDALVGGGSEVANQRLEELRTQESVETKWVPNGPEGPDATDEEGGYDETGWPTEDEILTLWHTFRSAADYVGYTPTMRDFGTWLAGTDACMEHVNQTSKTITHYNPAEVTW
jgi:hypothetical protein